MHERILDLGTEPEGPRDLRGDHAMRRHRFGGDATPVVVSVRRHPLPLQRRAAGADPAEQEAHQRLAGEIDPWARGAKLDLVPEMRRQLVRIGGAPHPRQHRRVIDGGALRIVHVHAIGEPERDPALAQHVLLRQTETEIGRQRQGRDQLSQAQAHVQVQAIEALFDGSDER